MTLSFLINAQSMEDQINIQETIYQLFINSDNRNWNGVEAQFSDAVLLDYSSMSGQPASTLTPQQITSAWKTVLPGFTYTHHQIGNVVITVDAKKAQAFCYGTATHYLEADEGNIWTVVGSYDFDLKQQDDTWKITTMRFNFKYQNGNSKLIEKAIENVKSN